MSARTVSIHSNRARATCHPGLHGTKSTHGIIHRPTQSRHATRRAALEDADIASTAMDAAASVPAPDDPVISVMFTLAVVALSVLTLGVAYLSISSFLDQRQEEEDRKKAGYGPSKAEGGARQPSTTFDESAFQPASGASKKKRKAPKKKSDKGFGN